MGRSEVSSIKILYGLLYGGLVAGIYLFTRLFGHNGGLNLFTLTVAIAFLLHLLVWPRLTLNGLKDRKMLLRGVFYGLTQVLILKAQANGHTSTALVASTMGSVFGVLFGRLLLKEKVTGLALVALPFCVVATLLNPLVILSSYWGVLGGLIQGSGFVLARSLMIEHKGTRESISTGFGVGAIVGAIALAIDRDLASMWAIPSTTLLLTITFVLIIQYAFFYLYKILDSQRASMLLLSRIPWALGLEYTIFGIGIAVSQAISSSLILIGALLLALDANVRRATVKSPLNPIRQRT